jgi:methyl-accepting chemotaxis protein
MLSTMSLRVRMLASFLAIIVGALLLAAVFGITRFDALMRDQAQRTVDTNINVASQLLADDLDGVRAAVMDTASDERLPSGTGTTRIQLVGDLSKRAQLTGLTYFALLEADGTVPVTSIGSPEYQSVWADQLMAVSSGVTTSGIVIVPTTELEGVGLDRRLRLEPKETENGTIVEGETEGALALVAAAPFRGKMLVGVKILKLDYAFVDSVVSKLDGTATLFQKGVRVSTTVRDAKGERAIGTIVSDAVRAETIDKGLPYRGEAFVVTKRYLAAYEPLRSPAGETVGMLYVGVDETPYAAATRGVTLTFGGVILAALLLAVLGAGAMTRMLARPLAAVASAAETVATGDLTTTVPTVGYREARELGDAFNTMTDGLRTIITQVEESIHQLRSVSGEITAASRTSADHATRQASAVAQTTATLQELSTSFQSVADGARRVLDVAENALESAQGGMATVDEGGGTMEELAVGAHDMAGNAEALTSVADNIGEMTSIITAISEQTKILALNAAIEAARAGEAGKGFSVVSSEIRALADSVGRSAGHIAELVSEIQTASTRLQESAARQSTLTMATLQHSHNSRQAFGMIVQQMEDTALAAREITEAAHQQQRSSEQLVEAMHQVSLSSSETAAAASQLAESADSVEIEAERMMNGLTRFKTH